AKRCLLITEIVDAAGAVRLVLQQVVADTLQIDAPLERMIALVLCPRVDNIDVGLGADPGKAGGIADHRLRDAVVQENADDAAGELVDIHAGNTEIWGGV